MLLRTIALLSLIVFLISPALRADEIRKIRGEAERFSPHSESSEEARSKAIQEAKINALEKAFGSAITDRTINISDSHDGHTRNTTHSYGESVMNGDWIRSIKEEIVKVVPTEHGNIYYAKVYGEAREVKFDKIDIECRLLCNGTDPNKNRLRGDIFYEGDEMYVYFTSPVGGWLSIYLIDDDDERTTQCLVPYDNQKEAAYPIAANKEYVFFSKRTAEPQYAGIVTRMIVEARKRVDVNDLYVIFSPNEFTQAASTVYKHSRHNTDETQIQADLMPRETTYERFDKWLYNKRRKDSQLQHIPITFSIRKK